MTNAEMKRFRAALEAKRQEFMRDIHDATARLAFGGGESDPVDQMLSMNERNFTAEILNRLSTALEDINQSLRAISDGSYGFCTECGEPIPPKRLQTIPWAAYCVPCQEELEDRGSGAELCLNRTEAA